MRTPTGLVLLALAFLGARAALAADGGKPRLNLRASPRVALTPVSVLTFAELVGGDLSEEYHCPRLEWDWGDGTRSERESDCEPYDGITPLERRYSARHVYRSPGQYDIRLTLRRASRVVAIGTTAVAVHGGPGADAY
jgi:hypothetical protein